MTRNCEFAIQFKGAENSCKFANEILRFCIYLANRQRKNAKSTVNSSKFAISKIANSQQTLQIRNFSLPNSQLFSAPLDWIANSQFFATFFSQFFCEFTIFWKLSECITEIWRILKLQIRSKLCKFAIFRYWIRNYSLHP